MAAVESRERSVLVSRLVQQRRHVLTQLEGLADDQLRRPVVPSGWTCLGLVRHLTLSDERYWFEVVVAGGPLDFWPEGERGDWVVAPEEAADDIVASYQSAAAASDAIIAERHLDDPPSRPEAWWADAGIEFPDLRSVLAHVIVETATHAGHLDVVRELLDGRQHIVV